MSFFQRSFLIRSSALIALTLGCTSPAIVGCGGGDDDVAPGDDTGPDGDVDSSVTEGGIDSGKDVGTDAKDSAVIDSGTDSGTDAKDSGTDVADTRPDAVDAADTADGGIDATDTAVADTGTADLGTDTTTTDTAPVDTSCGAAGSACAGGKICQASGVCGDCTTDAECGAATTGTLCFAGTCAAATCHPKTDITNCSGSGVNCCAKATAGECVAAVSGKTMCCDNSDCASAGPLTTCDAASNTCVCPAPTAGQLFVTATGSDTSGNGSASCPFATITQAVSTLSASPPAVASNISIGAGAYGAGCTNAGGCDATPIVVPAAISNGLTIAGTGGVTVKGSTAASWVFTVNASGTSMNGMTLVPQKVATASTKGGGGILLDAPVASGSGGVISQITVTGIGGAFPTGNGIRVRGGTSPIIGPAFVATGGDIGILVTDSAAGVSTPAIVSDFGAQTVINGTGTACIRVETTSSSTLPPYVTVFSRDAGTPVHLTNCGGTGIIFEDATASLTISSVRNVLIDRTLGGTPFIGFRLSGAGQASLGSSTVTGVGGVGIQADGTSLFTIASAVSSTGNTQGVYITGSARADINGLTATGSTGAFPLTASDGLRCDSIGTLSGTGTTLKLRNSTFLSNVGSGVIITGPGTTNGCTADLGSGSDAGNNTFNKTGSKNTRVGLCYTSTSAPQAQPFVSTWSCGVVGASCVGGTPTSSVTCAGTGDWSRQGGGNLAIPLGQTCCP